MPGGMAAGSASSKYMTAALADLFSCVGAGDMVSAKALLEGKHKKDKEVILSATNPAGITVLQHACHSGQAGGVKMLLEQGADPTWTSTKGSTPLHFACNNGHFDCAEALLTAGVDVDARNANGTTPLIIAAFGAHTRCVRLLLEHDADPNVRDNLGRRAGDSLCGAVTGLRKGAAAASARLGANGAAGTAATGAPGAGAWSAGGGSTNPENEPFSETRSLLAVARAQRSSRRTSSDPGAASTACATNGVHKKQDGNADASRAGASGAGGGITLGAAVACGGGRAETSTDGLDGSILSTTGRCSTSVLSSSHSRGGYPSAGAKTPSTSTSIAGSISRSSSSSSDAGRRDCAQATQGRLLSSPVTPLASVPAKFHVPPPERRSKQQAEGSCVPGVSGAASPTGAQPGTTSPAPRRVPSSRAATPMASPASSPLASPRRASNSSNLSSSASPSSPPSSSSQPLPNATYTSLSPSPAASTTTALSAAATASTASTDPELDQPHLQTQRSADLKAALAANAAMIRSMQEEERVFSAQRDLLERRRGEAGERRKDAEEHAALLRARAGDMSREEKSTRLTLTPGTTAAVEAVVPATMAAAAASGSSTPASKHGDNGSGSSSEHPPVFMLPSPVSKSNTNVSVFNISTRRSSRNASDDGGDGGGGSDGGSDGSAPSTFLSGSAPSAVNGQPPASAPMAIADCEHVPTTSTTWRRNRSIPPVPDFTMLPPDPRDDRREHGAPNADATPAAVAAAGAGDGGSAAGMEDDDHHFRSHSNRYGQQQQQQQQQQQCLSPDRGIGDACSSSRSPFRRGRLELQLQSPLRIVQRDGGDGGASRRGSAGLGRTSSTSSVPDAASDRERRCSRQHHQGGPEESNADMLEADQQSAVRGSSDTNLMLGARSEPQERAGSGSDASTAEALEAQSRRVQELEAELRATRRDNRYRDGRSQRTRTNANKRQRATTSFSSQHSRHSHHNHSDAEADCARGGFGDNKSCFSPRGATHTSPTSSRSSSFSDLEPMSPALRNEVRRLRAESAARGREHASLAAQHASLVLEKARQAGVLRNRVASADEEVERLSRKLREAQEKLEVQAEEAEALRRKAAEQQGVLDTRAHILEQALGRLENIGVALAEERSLNSAARRDSHDIHFFSVARGNADGGGSSARSDASADGTGSRNSGNITISNDNAGGNAQQNDDMASVEPETAPSMSVDGVSQVDGDDNFSSDRNDDHDDDDHDESDVAALQDAPDNGGGIGSSTGSGIGSNGGSSGSDGLAAVSRGAGATIIMGDVPEREYEEDGRGESVPMRDVEGGDNEASGSLGPGPAPPSGNVAAGAAAAAAVAAAATVIQETRPRGGNEMARIFSHQQIDAACAGFPDSSIVGRGGFGPVFRGRFMGEEVAVKRLDGYGLQGLPNFLREVQVLTTCRHEHLVPLLGICVDPTPMLVYPFVGQSLEWHLREPQRRAAINWSTRLSVALSVSKGLQYLHQPQAGAWGKPVIVHRDVKTENILMDANLKARLSDVGIARQLDRGGSEARTRLIGTWGYIDPEYQETGVLTPSSDVYSLGVVFLELLTGLPAHSAQLRPPSLVDRVIGKQLSDCLDSACTWPDTPPVVAFATEAWQCVSRKGDDRPRLQHLIERMERLDVEGTATDEASGADASESSTSTSTSDRDGSTGPARGGNPAGAFVSPSAGAPASATLPPAVSALDASGSSPIAAAPEAASSVAMAAAAAAATAARAATAAAAAATAVASEASALMLESPPTSSSSSGSSAASSPAMADAAAGAAVTPVIPVTQPQPPSLPPGRDCMICASAPVQTRFLPCRHSLACSACASLLRARGDRCPVDRARIDDFETGQFQVTYTGARETGS